MSVTSHLTDPASPVRWFFARRLGETAPVLAEIRATIRDGRSSPPLPGLGAPRLRGLVGSAADVLICAWLDPKAVPASAAQAPTRVGLDLLQAARVALRTAFASPGAFGPEDVRPLAPHALVLAALVAARRDIQARAWLTTSIAGADDTLASWAEHLWTADEEADLVALVQAALDDHAFAPVLERVVVNPEFALSRTLGGADGDVIAGRVLWDFKSGEKLRCEDVWQVIAYLLADTDDEHSLESVGISALRWRRRWESPAELLLARLSGEAHPLAHWRAEFAAVVNTEVGPGGRRERRRRPLPAVSPSVSPAPGPPGVAREPASGTSRGAGRRAVGSAARRPGRPMAAPLLDQIRTQIRDRMNELRPAVSESERLTEALDAIATLGAVPRTAPPAAVKPAPAKTQRSRRGSSRPTPC